MSFEGYYRILCTNGHLNEQDVYEGRSVDGSWKCFDCGAPPAWREIIDTTNEEESLSYPLTLIEPSKDFTCENCKQPVAHSIPAVYEIPNVEDDTFQYDLDEIEYAIKYYFEHFNHPEKVVRSIYVVKDDEAGEDIRAVIVTQPREHK